MADQIDLYSGNHKGQRGRFFKIATLAATLDFANQKSLDNLYDELYAFREQMWFHASAEEKLIHPMLSERVPGGARQLEEDHRTMHQHFDDLLAHFNRIRSASTEIEKRRKLLPEFYRGWNRFLAFYLMHIDYEEEKVQPTLWKLCTNEELFSTYKAFMASQTPLEIKYNFEMMLPNMNIYERTDMLLGAKVTLSPDAFNNMAKLAEHLLSSNDWVALKTKIGMT